jgi:hypothetical protein
MKMNELKESVQNIKNKEMGVDEDLKVQSMQNI